MFQEAATSIRSGAREITGYWWSWLVAGVAWVAVALVILQFDQASITTVGVLVGFMFALTALENFALASFDAAHRGLSVLFGVLFTACAVICFISPEQTFAGLADMLGFLFLTVGLWWMTRSFLERPVNPLWWIGLISGILMTILAFWTAGQFFIDRAYTLLALAGIWALMGGITNIVRAFQVRALHEEL
jgi:uncharacterized membrane protein HdeD (DUF308 family)